MSAANQENEETWCAKTANRFKGTPEEVEAKVREAGKNKKLHCVKEKEIRNPISELFMSHLQWHPYIHLGSVSDVVVPGFTKQTWEGQTREMYNLCKHYRQS